MPADEYPTLGWTGDPGVPYGRCTPEQQALAESCRPYALYWARRYLGLLDDEAYGIAMLHLVRAALDYREEAGYFELFAKAYVKNGLTQAVRELSAQKRGGFNRRAKHARAAREIEQLGVEFHELDVCSREPGPGHLLEVGEEADQVLALLPEGEHDVAMLLSDGMTLAEAGRCLGLSRQRAHQLLARARGRVAHRA